MKWDAYIHTNGNLIIKRLWGEESTIDTNSPFVAEYIQPVEADTREEAERLLCQKIKEKK